MVKRVVCAATRRLHSCRECVTLPATDLYHTDMSATLRVSLSYVLTRGRALAVCVAAAGCWVAALPAAANEPETPAGRWQTFDDQTHAARGVINIFERDGRWFGRIERPGRHDLARCDHCTDERKDQPLDGLVIIRNMQRATGDEPGWDGGDILDPDTGRVYRLKMRLEERGAKLVLRGYFGVSLLGRTQTWARLP